MTSTTNPAAEPTSLSSHDADHIKQALLRATEITPLPPQASPKAVAKELIEAFALIDAVTSGRRKSGP